MSTTAAVTSSSSTKQATEVTVPLLDLKAQYATIRAEIEPVVKEVIESQYFIGGPKVDQIEREIASVTADGAYDSEPTYYQAITSRQPGRPPTVIIPPRSTAVAGNQGDAPPSQRDRHIGLIQEKGRMV